MSSHFADIDVSPHVFVHGKNQTSCLLDALEQLPAKHQHVSYCL